MIPAVMHQRDCLRLFVFEHFHSCMEAPFLNERGFLLGAVLKGYE